MVVFHITCFYESCQISNNISELLLNHFLQNYLVQNLEGNLIVVELCLKFIAFFCILYAVYFPVYSKIFPVYIILLTKNPNINNDILYPTSLISVTSVFSIGFTYYGQISE